MSATPANKLASQFFHRPPKVRSTALFQNPCQINHLAKYVGPDVFHPRIAAMEKPSQLGFSPPPVAAP